MKQSNTQALFQRKFEQKKYELGYGLWELFSDNI